ncbi:MAG: hypothetical protein AB8H80_11885 [Planctomycetota bacterium]
MLLRFARGGGVWLLLLALGSCVAKPPEMAPDSIQSRWLRSIEQQDWPAMGPLLAERAIYVDSSKRDYDTEPYYVIGRQAIVDFWKRRAPADPKRSRVQFSLLDYDESSSVSVLTLRADIFEWGGVRTDVLADSVWMTTALTVEDGVIVHLQDHHSSADAVLAGETQSSARDR